MNDERTNGSSCAETVPKESSIARLARELMEVAARLHGREPYVPPPPRVSREEIARRREAAELESHEVYFLYSCNKIKIGTSNHHLRRILREIAPYCPSPLWLIGAIPGGPIIEARLHEQFRDARAHDEWFDLSAELRAYLCQDRARAERLDEAEESYRDWLEDQLTIQKEQRK